MHNCLNQLEQVSNTIEDYVGYGFSIHFLNITLFFNWNGL